MNFTRSVTTRPIASPDTGRAALSSSALGGRAVAAGVLLGAGDLLLQRVLPYPWANLANSSAVWAVGAFLLAAGLSGRLEVTRRDLARAAAVGALLLVVAVETYYATAVMTLGSGMGTLYGPTALAWVVLGVLAGVVFAPAGLLARRAAGWLGAAGVAVGVAVVWGEAAQLFLQPATPGQLTRGEDGTALITALTGVLLLVGVRPQPASVARAGLLALPLSGLVLAAFRLAGFAY